MADIVHARDDQSIVGAGRSAVPRQTGAADRRNEPPRTDAGTLTLHWLVATAFIVSLLTGIRIAADSPTAVVSKWL
jgi:hypothetical protein